jgi:hypothetical protein
MKSQHARRGKSIANSVVKCCKVRDDCSKKQSQDKYSQILQIDLCRNPNALRRVANSHETRARRRQCRLVLHLGVVTGIVLPTLDDPILVGIVAGINDADTAILVIVNGHFIV